MRQTALRSGCQGGRSRPWRRGSGGRPRYAIWAPSFERECALSVALQGWPRRGLFHNKKLWWAVRLLLAGTRPRFDRPDECQRDPGPGTDGVAAPVLRSSHAAGGSRSRRSGVGVRSASSYPCSVLLVAGSVSPPANAGGRAFEWLSPGSGPRGHRRRDHDCLLPAHPNTSIEPFASFVAASQRKADRCRKQEATQNP